MMGGERGESVRKLLRFATVGFLTAALYAFILVIAVEIVGVLPAVGAGVAYVVAIGFNYVAHYAWTYKADQPHRSTAPRYLISIVIFFCINVIATASLPAILGVGYGAVQILLMLCMAVATFITLSKWVFSTQQSPT